MTNDSHLLQVEELKTYFNTFEGIVLFADWLREELNPKIERSA
jgi:hypothetical protein